VADSNRGSKVFSREYLVFRAFPTIGNLKTIEINLDLNRTFSLSIFHPISPEKITQSPYSHSRLIRGIFGKSSKILPIFSPFIPTLHPSKSDHFSTSIRTLLNQPLIQLAKIPNVSRIRSKGNAVIYLHPDVM